MNMLVTTLVIVGLLILTALTLVRVVKRDERGVLFRLGRLVGSREPGLRIVVPLIDVLRRVSLHAVTLPIQTQGIATGDNVSVDVSAVVYFRVVDAVKSVVAIENVRVAIDRLAQTALRTAVGQHTLDETLAETYRISGDIRQILDDITADWGVAVTLVELTDIQPPGSRKQMMTKPAEGEYWPPSRSARPPT